MGVDADQIVKLRKTLGLTQEEFGRHMGFSRSYVKDIETGRSEVSRRFLSQMAINFGVSVDSLMVDNVVRRAYYALRARGFKNSFAFVYGFTDNELVMAEAEARAFLSDKPHSVVDAGELTKWSSFFERATGETSSSRDLVYDLYSNHCIKFERFFIVLKNLSNSKMVCKGGRVRELAKLHEIIPLPLEHVVILIDRPSFLEKYQEELYSYAIPIRFVSREQKEA